MQPYVGGAAFVDRSGAVIVADAGFLARLDLPAQDPTGALRARAETDPPLRALLAGEGPATVTLPCADGTTTELERVPSDGGALLVARAAQLGEWLEDAMRAHGMGRVAGGVAHDIKNPLNALSLRIALLEERLSGSADASDAAASHLRVMLDQIGRVNAIVRRFMDLADPSSPLGYTDLGALAADLGSLLAHDARQRSIELVVEPPQAPVRTACDPVRVGRLLLGLVSRALAETPDGGRLAVRAETRGALAALEIEHVAGDPDPALGYYTGVAAAAARALGGELSVVRSDGTERLSLALPRNDRV
jgi:signal transduction histidine kinase